MIVLLLVLTTITTVALLIRALFRIEVIHFTLASVPLSVAGVLELGPLNVEAAATLGGCFCALVVSYYSILLLREPAVRVKHQFTDMRGNSSIVVGIVAVTAIGCLYHFAVAGIPILSSNVEVERFDVGRSGLGGVPSRLYLYGTFIALAVAVGDARTRKVAVYRDRLVVVAFALLLGTRLASGFKSGVLQVVIYSVLLVVLAGAHISIARSLRLALISFGAIVASLYLVGSQYRTYDQSGKSLTESLIHRVTYETARPIAVLMRLRGNELGDSRSVFRIDVEYFIPRYFGVGDETRYSFVRRFAAYLFDVPPDPDVIIQPVTTGALAELKYDFSVAGALVGAVILGIALGYCARSAPRSVEHPVRFAATAVLCQMIIDYISKGSLVYSFLNWYSTFAILAIVGMVSERVGPAVNKHASGPGRRSDEELIPQSQREGEDPRVGVQP